MGQITAPDHIVDGSAEDRAFAEAQQRAIDKLTFGGEHDMLVGAEDSADPVRSAVFGTLAGAALIAWAFYALWRYLT